MVGSKGRAFLCSSPIPRLIFGSSTPRPSMYNSIMYSHQDHHEDERAPSTADEFRRVAEERQRGAEQGVASQTVEKTYDRAEEAVTGDSDDESLNKRYKAHEEDADYRKTGDDEPGE